MIIDNYVKRVKETKEKHAERQKEFEEKRQAHLDRMDYLDNLNTQVDAEIKEKLNK